MTLEDAIVYYSESAKECRRKARIESNDYMDMKDSVYEAEQLAGWLNELKVLRERINAQPELIRCKDCKYNVSSHKCLQPDSFFLVTSDDFYCGYAKRRTDEGMRGEQDENR